MTGGGFRASHAAGGVGSGVAAWEEVGGGFLKWLNSHHTTQQFHFWVYTRENRTRVHVCTRTSAPGFTTALLTVARKEKRHKGPPTGEWTEEAGLTPQCKDKGPTHDTMWMSRENMPSARGQRKGRIAHDIRVQKGQNPQRQKAD